MFAEVYFGTYRWDLGRLKEEKRKIKILGSTQTFYSLTAARRQEEDGDALGQDLVLEGLVVVIRHVVEDEHGLLRLWQVAHQHPDEPLVTVAIIAFAELVEEVGPLVGDGAGDADSGAPLGGQMVIERLLHQHLGHLANS